MGQDMQEVVVAEYVIPGYSEEIHGNFPAK
jgi:hypothetical protein